MNVAYIKDQLQIKYPGKFIVENKVEGVVKEILCEIEPTSEHPEYSKAIAVIDKSLPHYHKDLTEIYTILHGNLTLYVSGKSVQLKEGDIYVIQPNLTHWAEGNETWIEVSSNPEWTLEDHMLV